MGVLNQYSNGYLTWVNQLLARRYLLGCLTSYKLIFVSASMKA